MKHDVLQKPWLLIWKQNPEHARGQSPHQALGGPPQKLPANSSMGGSSSPRKGPHT